MHISSTRPSGGNSARRARRGLTIFFAVVVALSAPIEAIAIWADLDGGANGAGAWILLMAALMFVPTIASVVARLALREGFADVSFRIKRGSARSFIVQSLVLVGSICLASYGIGWASGLILFAMPPLGIWLVTIIIALIINVVLASGEEIGWRGYMLTRLIDAGVPQPVLASGLIWGAWHIPLILWGGFADGPSPLLSTMLLMVLSGALGSVHALMRLETGSVWSSVALHVVWNVVVQNVFDPMAIGAQRSLWVGETGVLTVAVGVVAAVLYARRSGVSTKAIEDRRVPPAHSHAQSSQQ